jgi:VanZ family protein
MHARLAMTALRVLTWSGVVLLAVLSLLPEQTLGAHSSVDVIRMVRAIVSAPIEHFLAYAGMAALSVAVYGSARSGMRIIGGLWVYAGILECIRHFSPGRHPSVADFAAGALGALCGGLVIALLWRSLPVSPPLRGGDPCYHGGSRRPASHASI